jgi:hypothetical protein
VTGRGKRRNKRKSLKVVQGQRETLERELFLNIAFEGDLARREQLNRILSPAANAPLLIVPLVGASSSRGTEDAQP